MVVVVVVTAAVLVIAAIATLPLFGRAFLPEFNEGALTILVNTVPGTSLDESNQIGHQVVVTGDHEGPLGGCEVVRHEGRGTRLDHLEDEIMEEPTRITRGTA